MPGFHTHYFFGQQIKNKPKQYPKSYALGLQGPDIFFHTINAHLLYRENIGVLMHDNRTNDVFEALLKIRRHLKTTEAKVIADSFIKGFMAHYTLDSIVHPYVYARTKHTQHDDRKTYDFGIHVFLETDMDTAVLRHFMHMKPTEFKPWETIALSPKEKTVITFLLFHAIKEAFPEVHMHRFTVLAATRAMWRDEYLMHDEKGRKKAIVRLLEDKFFGHAVVSSMIPNDDFRLYKDPCNLRHMTWKNPWDKKMESKEDLYRMMDRAAVDMERRINLYNAAYRATTNEEYYRNITDLLNDLGGLSYLSGLKV